MNKLWSDMSKVKDKGNQNSMRNAKSKKFYYLINRYSTNPCEHRKNEKNVFSIERETTD